MKHTILIACMAVLTANFSYAQDSTALINTTWLRYANDTSLTYRQIVTTCDSLYVLAGYPVFPDTTHSGSGALAPVDSIAADDDGSSFMGYLVWKNFWSNRCDVATGKLHNFAEDARGMMSSGVIPYCVGTSTLQTNSVTVPGVIPGWTWIGPQNISAAGELSGNSLHQHIGQVDAIIVNTVTPSEIYVTDAWGGIWKTNNANLAPNNTWSCLSDNLPYVAGIGITDLYVDFSTTPHTLYCLAGIPFSKPIQNNSNYNPHTVGLFYSTDDGATFNLMDISAAIPDLASNPILAMQYWPGNAGISGHKYIFITTQFQIYRLDVYNPGMISYATMTDVLTSSVVPSDHQTSRFRGFNAINFLPADPTVMYVATTSNNGQDYAATAGLYRISSCTSCAPCTLTGIPLPAADYLGGGGDFSAGGMPWNAGWTYQPTPQNMQCVPTPTVSSTEVSVDGSYLDNITYNISFTLTLPPGTETDVILKDANDANQDKADWGNSITPTPSSVMTYSVNFGVGGGYASGATATPGHYINDLSTDYTFTITPTSPVSVTPTHFVDRLEFGAYLTGSYSTYNGHNIILDNLEIVQPFQNYVNSLTTTPAAPNDLYCVTSDILYANQILQKIEDVSGTFSITPYSMPNPGSFLYLHPSSIDPDIMYVYTDQSSNATMLWKYNIPSATYTDDGGNAESALHVDARCMFTMPNAAGTDDSLFIGEDGGIGTGSFSGSWQNLNGTGMKTCWGYDIGTSAHTGDVGIAATDQGIFLGNEASFASWQYHYDIHIGDGGQVKYGKRYATRNVRFEGSSSSSGFVALQATYLNGTPAIRQRTVNVPTLGKLVTTNNGEYFGTGTGGDCNVYNVMATLTSTVTPTYSLRLFIRSLQTRLIRCMNLCRP